VGSGVNVGGKKVKGGGQQEAGKKTFDLVVFQGLSVQRGKRGGSLRNGRRIRLLKDKRSERGGSSTDDRLLNGLLGNVKGDVGDEETSRLNCSGDQPRARESRKCPSQR